MLHRDALNALAREVDRAREAMTVERAVRAALMPLLALGGWVTVTLLGLPDLAPPLATTLLGLAALGGVAFLAWTRLSRVRRPTEDQARARLMADAGLERGAFDTLVDTPTRLDPLSLALWRREQTRAAETVSRARARPPRPAIAAADPFRLRFAVPAALLVALLVAGADAPDRLVRAFYPDPGPLVGDKPMAIEAWVTPASYTGGVPVSLSDRIGDTVPCAPSPEATVRVTGPAGAPWLIYDGKSGHKRVRFTRASDGAWETRMMLSGPGTLRIERFHTKALWRIRPTADTPPSSTLVGDVSFDKEETIAVRWRAKDDFGVSGLAVRMTPVDPPPGLKGARPVDTDVEAPAGDPRQAEGEAHANLADHPYAGMKVRIQIVARDSLGQEGVSEAVTAKLPEKIFLQPLARAAIEIRKHILYERRAYARHDPYLSPKIVGAADLFGIKTDDEDPRITRAPHAIRHAGRMIDALTVGAEDGYFRDMAVYLGFRFARSTLDQAREIGETTEAANILWHVALRAEYGDSADARRALEEAQRRLSEAISNGASAEEIDRLSEALARATQTYIEALAQEAVREGKRAESEEDSSQQRQELSEEQIQRMMDEVKRRAQAGDTAGAQALLQQLSDLLNKLEIKLANGQDKPGKDGPPSDLEKAAEGLSEQIGRQRQLNDETQQQEQDQQSGGQSQQKRQESQQQQQELGERQEQLSRDLKAAQEKADGAGAKGGGEDLSQAGQAMNRAARALKQGDLDEAGRQQQQALRDLRRGAERLSNQALAEKEGRTGEASQRQEQGETDPLGRRMGGMGDNGDETRVPGASQRQHAREILDEVRRRAQDNRRPEAEREYLRRLLERFTGA